MGPGISADDIILQANGFGDLTIAFLDSPDSITIPGDLTNQSGVVFSAVSHIEFSDGASMDLGQAANGQGAPLTFTWLGNSSNFSLSGADFGTNVFDVTGGGGSVTFGNTNDGGDGQNIIDYAVDAGHLTVSLNSGTGVIQFGSGVTASDVDVQADGSGDLTVTIAGDATDSITVFGDLVNQSGTVTSGISELQFSDGSSINLTQNPITFTWFGNASNYTLTGTTFGSNLFDLRGGSGRVNFANNTSVGGTNTIDYVEGDGVVTATLNGGMGAIDFGAGITAQDVYLQSNGFGDMTVGILGDATDSITVFGDLVNQSGTVTSGIRELQFSDGSSINLTQNPITFTWFGNASDFSLSGSDFGANAFDVTGGGGSVTFGNTSDGGDGQNTINYAEGSGRLEVSLNRASGTIDFGAGVTASDVDLQANSSGDLTISIAGDGTDSIVVFSDLQDNNGVVTSGIQQLQFSDGTSIDMGPGSSPQFTWIGTQNASLSGSNFGANTFVLGGGSESVTGGGIGNGGNGNNTYIASSNTGQVTINANAAIGSTNELEFAGGITDENLWLEQSGNDLKINLLGTDTQVDISGWFNGSSNQLQEIMAGGLKIASQISQLVQAMATYSANNPGFDPAASGGTVPNDPNLQAAVGAAWHS